ncbi:NADH dehydrogenase (ubiquinone) 1 alpha subcomplex subunit 12, partial [Tremellales sp. Uapishka_1]
MSLPQVIRSIRAGGLKEFFRQMTYIGTAKQGRLVGTDKFGNRYFENNDWTQVQPGRQRWIDFSQDDFNASQVPPEWHSWLGHIRKDAPQDDPIMVAATPPWLAPFRENLTGTRGAFKTYSTTVPKINAWEPTVRPREGGKA